MKQARWQGNLVFISRLGYTGEDGFEISINQEMAVKFWNALLMNPAVKTIGLAGKDGGALRTSVDLPIIVPSPITARIQECHIAIAHFWCEMLDANLK